VVVHLSSCDSGFVINSLVLAGHRSPSAGATLGGTSTALYVGISPTFFVLSWNKFTLAMPAAKWFLVSGQECVSLQLLVAAKHGRLDCPPARRFFFCRRNYFL
jgi:hypothetical protein